MSDKDNTLKANESLLNGLHQIVAADLIARISSGEATVQELSAAIKFLKDNDVTADIAFNTPLRQLEQEVTPVGELPFFDEEDDDDSD
tara:strand:+ start:317 stop:580 length:264 start_codon:yes stop_codon:yes gene_type:complete